MKNEPDWRPYASQTTPTVHRLAKEEAVDLLGKQVDAALDAGGHNNYWEATSALGAGWSKSGLKWKWRSKLDGESLAAMAVAAEEVPAQDKAGIDELNLRLRRSIVTTAQEEPPEPLGRQICVSSPSADAPFRGPLAAKIAGTHMDTWVMEEEDTQVNPHGRFQPPAQKKPRFGIFSGPNAAAEPKPVVDVDGSFRPSGVGRFGFANLPEPRSVGSRGFGLPIQEDPSWRYPRSQGARGEAQSNNAPEGIGAFRTAGQLLASSYGVSSTSSFKTLGVSRPPSTLASAFKPPILDHNSPAPTPAAVSSSEEILDERLKNVDPKMIELIRNEIMDHGSAIDWDDIAGLEFVKSVIKEIVVFPMLRPDIFKGLKAPPKGILLFGPPGTGKTLIGKCIASRSKSTFFAISASSLTSKWIGEGEKMVRALFAVARVHQPSVVFIDEIDSLLSSRSDTEHESSRRLKTEFLVRLDGATTEGDERILIVGATNRPQDLDEAARRRLVKRLYVPLPEAEARLKIIENLMRDERTSLTPAEKSSIVARTQGYSGADMANLCRDAAIGPIRGLDCSMIEHIADKDIRPISIDDFTNALRQVKASVSDKDLEMYMDWDKRYGSGK